MVKNTVCITVNTWDRYKQKDKIFSSTHTHTHLTRSAVHSFVVCIVKLIMSLGNLENWKCLTQGFSYGWGGRNWLITKTEVTEVRSHLETSSSPVMVLGSGEYLGVVRGAGLTDWLPLRYGLMWLSWCEEYAGQKTHHCFHFLIPFT